MNIAKDKVLNEIKTMMKNIVKYGSEEVKDWISLEKDKEKKKFLNTIYKRSIITLKEGIEGITLQITD